MNNFKKSENLKMAENLNTPIETLKILSTDENKKVQLAVAKNPNTPTETLETFFKNNNEDYQFRWALAENPNISTEILRELSNDEDSRIRYAVAQNSSTPIDVLETFVENSNEDYKPRYYVAKNLNTPIDMLKDLAVDSNEIVRERISRRADAQEILNSILDDYSKTNIENDMGLALDDLKNIDTLTALNKLYETLKDAKETGVEIKEINNEKIIEDTKKVEITDL